MAKAPATRSRLCFGRYVGYVVYRACSGSYQLITRGDKGLLRVLVAGYQALLLADCCCLPVVVAVFVLLQFCGTLAQHRHKQSVVRW